MERIHQLINEINELKSDLTRRSAIQICHILANNRAIFEKEIDKDYLRSIIETFERLANASAPEYTSADYKRELQKVSELLSFHLNRVL